MDALDGLLGRQSLKEEIESLEAEIARLESQLEAEQDRRRDAVRDRQAAQERVNQLEDRIAGLEGELAHQQGDEREIDWSRVRSVPLQTVEQILETIESVRTEPEGMCVASVHESPNEDVKALLPEHWPLLDDISPCLVCVDDHHLLRVVLAPPRPPDAFIRWDSRAAIERTWFLPQPGTTFALVRADLFAVGSIEDGTVTYDEGFESEVMGRHSKGGFSQARFERRRGEQIDYHVDRCRSVLEERGSEDVVLVGDRRIVSRLSETATVTGVVDASGSPADALQEGFRDFWTTRIYLP